MRIRPFDYTDADYEAAIAVNNACFPDNPDSVANWQYKDTTRDPKYWLQRDMIEVDGKIAATSIMMDTAWSYQPGKYFLAVSVHPDYRRRDIATAWHKHALQTLDARPHPPKMLLSRTMDDQPEGIAMLQKLGFRQVMRERVSRLDVTTFDPAPFAPAMEKAWAADIQIKPLTDLQQTDPDWKRKLWKMETGIYADIPSPDELTPVSLEQYEREILQRPAFRPAGCFVALHGDTYVGLTCLVANLARADRLQTGLTGVRRDYRRMGIATALKVQSIEQYAKPSGVTEVATDNEENNPMYQINLRLGFKPAPGRLSYQKDC